MSKTTVCIKATIYIDVDVPHSIVEVATTLGEFPVDQKLREVLKDSLVLIVDWEDAEVVALLSQDE